MVCAGITYDSGVNNRITVTYNEADGTKGASYSNPYTFQDIYDKFPEVLEKLDIYH